MSSSLFICVEYRTRFYFYEFKFYPRQKFSGKGQIHKNNSWKSAKFYLCLLTKLVFFLNCELYLDSVNNMYSSYINGKNWRLIALDDINDKYVLSRENIYLHSFINF